MPGTPRHNQAVDGISERVYVETKFHGIWSDGSWVCRVRQLGPGHQVHLDTAPVKQGRIFCDDKFLGVAPVTVDLKSPRSIMKARAEKEALWSVATEFTKDQTPNRDDRWKKMRHTNVASDIANKW